MDLNLTSRGSGVVLTVQAAPGSRQNRIVGIRNGALRVAVTQVAEKGKANQALVRVLASELDVGTGQISLISGETSKQKRFLIESLSVAELRRRIEAILR